MSYFLILLLQSVIAQFVSICYIVMLDAPPQPLGPQQQKIHNRGEEYLLDFPLLDYITSCAIEEPSAIASPVRLLMHERL